MYGQSAQSGRGGRQPARAHRQRELPATRASAIIELAMRRLVACDWLVEVVRAVWIGGAVVHLAVPGHPRREVVGETRHQPLGPDRANGWCPNEHFAMVLVSSPINCFRANLWLKNRRNWLGFARRTFNEEGSRIVADYDPALSASLRGIDPERPLVFVVGEHGDQLVGPMLGRAPSLDVGVADPTA